MYVADGAPTSGYRGNVSLATICLNSKPCFVCVACVLVSARRSLAMNVGIPLAIYAAISLP